MKTNIFKTFAKTITTGFLCATVICGSVLGDVFECKTRIYEAEIKNEKVKNPEDFVSFIKWYPKLSLSKMFFKFPNYIKWQMLGFAVFFPKGSSEPQQVYVAKKRKYQNGQFLADIIQQLADMC